MVLSSCFNSFNLLCLEYCFPVWSSAADSHLKLLDKNLRCCKFLIPDLNISLPHRRSVSSLCMLYEIFNNPSHPLHSDLLELLHLVHVTRYAFNSNSLSFSHVSIVLLSILDSLLQLRPLCGSLHSVFIESYELQKFMLGAIIFLLD